MRAAPSSAPTRPVMTSHWTRCITPSQDTLFPAHPQETERGRPVVIDRGRYARAFPMRPGSRGKYMCTVFNELDSTTIWHVQFSRGYSRSVDALKTFLSHLFSSSILVYIFLMSTYRLWDYQIITISAWIINRSVSVSLCQLKYIYIYKIVI